MRHPIAKPVPYNRGVVRNPVIPGGLFIDVHPPRKTDRLYEFHIDVAGRPFTWAAAMDRLRATAAGYGSLWHARERFGFRAVNFAIRHVEIWDSVFPLTVLTRIHGPLYKRGFDAAIIRFHYPIHERVRQFFVDRAARMGLTIEIQADTFDRTYSIEGRGHIISFGSGKESRLLLGVLRELGIAPRLATGGTADRPPDLEVEYVDLVRGTTTERTFPGLMAGAAHYYYGATLGTVHVTRPWHQYYDRGSPEGTAAFEGLLRALGVDVRLHVPLVVLPTNRVQHILAARYPELSRHQRSVSEKSEGEKHLEIALAGLYHRVPVPAVGRPEALPRIAERLVRRMRANPRDFGYNGHREIHRREMLALLWRLRDVPWLAHVRPELLPEWDARWIDHIHTYVHPSVDPAWLAVVREYATDYVPGPGEFRVPTPAIISAAGTA